MTPVSLRIRKMCSSPSQWVRGIVLDRGKLESLPVIVREYQSMAKKSSTGRNAVDHGENALELRHGMPNR